MLKTIFLDLDDTLLDFRRAEQQALSRTLRHFAIDPTLRNGGYGSRVMQHLLAQLDRPLVLEVEVPEDELTRRRVAFYERQGFRICDKDYVQPPYRTGGASLPLYLMVAGDASAELPTLEDVRKGIYREVYRVDC